MRILCNIIYGCRYAGAVCQSDQAFLLQQKKCSCLVGGVVRNRDGVAVCNVIQAGLGSAVDSEGLIVDLTILSNCKVCAVLLVEGVQVIHMLEIVRIKVAGLYYVVGLYVILEYGNLQLIALFLQKILYRIKNLRVRCLRSSNLDYIVAVCSCLCGCFLSCLCGCLCRFCCSFCRCRCRGIGGRAAAAGQKACCQCGCCEYC